MAVPVWPAFGRTVEPHIVQVGLPLRVSPGRFELCGMLLLGIHGVPPVFPVSFPPECRLIWAGPSKPSS